MKIYIATRFYNREAAKTIANTLKSSGNEITSRWLDGEVGNTPKEISLGNLQDVDRSDCFLWYTDNCASVPGGMHFEAGYAYAKGIKVFVLGPQVNIFCSLAEPGYESSIS